MKLTTNKTSDINLQSNCLYASQRPHKASKTTNQKKRWHSSAVHWHFGNV